jgi:hypothetical protein
MVNITSPEWVTSAGYQFLNSTENVSMISAGVEGLRYSQGYTSMTHPGYAFVLAFTFLLLLVGVMVFTRTQKFYASVFVVLLMYYALSFFNLVYHWVVYPLTVALVIGIALEVVVPWWQKD